MWVTELKVVTRFFRPDGDVCDVDPDDDVGDVDPDDDVGAACCVEFKGPLNIRKKTVTNEIKRNENTTKNLNRGLMLRGMLERLQDRFDPRPITSGAGHYKQDTDR